MGRGSCLGPCVTHDLFTSNLTKTTVIKILSSNYLFTSEWEGFFVVEVCLRIISVSSFILNKCLRFTELGTQNYFQ